MCSNCIFIAFPNDLPLRCCMYQNSIPLLPISRASRSDEISRDLIAVMNRILEILLALDISSCICKLERFLQRSHGNQLIHRRVSKTKSISKGFDPKSQAGRQSDGYCGWCLETGVETGRAAG